MQFLINKNNVKIFKLHLNVMFIRTHYHICKIYFNMRNGYYNNSIDSFLFVDFGAYLVRLVRPPKFLFNSDQKMSP